MYSVELMYSSKRYMRKCAKTFSDNFACTCTPACSTFFYFFAGLSYKEWTERRCVAVTQNCILHAVLFSSLSTHTLLLTINIHIKTISSRK